MEPKAIKDFIRKFLILNRKTHIYFGLFILLFIWLFAVSGLLINHGEWKFASFFEQREEHKTDFILPVSMLTNNPDLVSQVNDKLKISGEVDNLKITSGNIDFRVYSPGKVRDIHINSMSGVGIIKEMNYNFWGRLKTLHLFNGTSKADPAKTPNWIVTKIWRFTMDITAVVIILLCLGSWVMWYRIRSEYKPGYFLLAFSLIVSMYYVFFIDLL